LFAAVEDVDRSRLEQYFGKMTRRGWHWAIEHAPLSLREAVSSWESTCKSGHVQNALREQFDPQGILAHASSS